MFNDNVPGSCVYHEKGNVIFKIIMCVCVLLKGPV